jgi:phosphopantothenoylcysteine synthetase/decarboxylase
MARQIPRFLVTAGSTREMIDRVRDWGNIFTGNTGLAIARALADIGEVDLLTSNRQHLADVERGLGAKHPTRAAGFTSHADLKASLARRMAAQSYDAVFMTAAVADYKPTRVFAVLDATKTTDGTQTWVVRDVHADKIKSSYPTIAVLGEQTEKLVDLFRCTWNHKGLLFKFKLEVGISTDELIRIGQASRRASGADFLVANTLEMVEGPQAGAYLLSEGGAELVSRANLPKRLATIVEGWLSQVRE